MLGPLKRFWERDGSLSVLLAVLALGIFLALPAAGGQGLGLAGQLVLSVVLLSGLTVTARAHWLLRPAAVLVAATLAVGWLAQIGGDPIATTTSLALGLVYLSALTVVVLERVIRTGPVTVHRISGAVAAYLLIAILFANVFALVELVQPGSFNGVTGGRGWGGFLYFSQVTLFTVGYGDITPVAGGARSLAMLEGLIGQLYPAILLARLVALEIEDRRTKKRG
jgi:hypothetical protein